MYYIIYIYIYIYHVIVPPSPFSKFLISSILTFTSNDCKVVPFACFRICDFLTFQHQMIVKLFRSLVPEFVSAE